MAELICLSDSDMEDHQESRRPYKRSLRDSNNGQSSIAFLGRAGSNKRSRRDSNDGQSSSALLDRGGSNKNNENLIDLGLLIGPKENSKALQADGNSSELQAEEKRSADGLFEFWGCAACTFHNDLKAPACNLCNTVRDCLATPSPSKGKESPKESGRDIIILQNIEKSSPKGEPELMMLACGLCNASVNLDMVYTLDSCDHKVCRPCVQGYTAKLLDSAPNTALATCSDLFNHMVCPVQACERSMSLEDLAASVGMERVRAHQAWLLSTMDRLFGGGNYQDPVIRKPCPVAACKGKMISLRAIVQLDHAELKGALKAFGASVRGTRSTQLKNMTSQVRSVLAPVHPQDPTSANREPGPGLEVCLMCRHVACSVCTEAHGAHAPLCSLNQSFSVFQLLKRLDNSLADTPRPKPKQKSAKNKQPATNDDLPSWGKLGRGKKSVWATGTGFGGSEYSSLSKPAEGNAAVAAAQSAQAKEDALIQSVLEELTEMLTQWRLSRLHVPMPIIALLCGRRTLWRTLRLLAQNDSFMDVAERRQLYHELLKALGEIGHHPELLPLLCCPPPHPLDGAGSSLSGKDCEHETGTVLDALNNLHSQSQVALQLSHEGTEDDDMALDIALASEIESCYNTLMSSVRTWRSAHPEGPSTPPHNQTQKESAQAKAKGKKKLSFGWEMVTSRVTRGSLSAVVEEEERKKQEAERKQMEDKYKEALGPLRFRQGENMAQDHFFRRNLTGQGSAIDINGVHNKARSRRITKEMPSLATSLPLEWASSIHVCMDENRSDVLKALIIGPGGTPYQNGFFLFDILLPADYPNVPPKVQFLTTGGGSVRFNPNLYACGKVCLSLLGTWSGPGWDPVTSTLLQVLVSIQSLILVPDPYYNEPGRECMSLRQQAEDYNSEQRSNTLQFAILPFLANPPKHFADIVSLHLVLKRDEILKQCNEWVALSNKHYMATVEASTNSIQKWFDASASSSAAASAPPADKNNPNGGPPQKKTQDLLSMLG